MADVVRLYPDHDLTDDDALMRQDSKPRDCSHRKIRLDQTAHRAYCRDCNLEVDLFDFVWRLAGQWEVWVRQRKEAKRRAVAAQARLDETLRLERNARARVKRLDPEAKLPQVPWGEASA